MGKHSDRDWQSGLARIAEEFSPEMAERLRTYTSSEPFGAEMGDFVLRHAYLPLWLRPGLPRRERSLITVAMLLALGSEEELAVHVRIAIENGCTVEELEELVYHATVYAGFPRATAARATIQQSLLDAGESFRARLSAALTLLS